MNLIHMCSKCVLQRCLELAVLLRYQLELLYSLPKKTGSGAPWDPIFEKNLYIQGKMN